ncbi:MAG: choice-of-anchor D domain-containing protein [Myxococcota bacterium]
MRSGRVSLALFLSALPLVACECDPTLNRVAPRIELAFPGDDDGTPCAELGVRDCAFDFGDVPIGSARQFRVLLKNPSPVDLILQSIELSDDSDPSFSIEGEVPTSVLATDGTKGELLIVQFTPTVASQVTARLIIRSDAANLDPGEDVEVLLTGNGLDQGYGDLVVSPPSCDFGDVGVGVTAYCDLSLENAGERELLVTGISFSADTDRQVFGPSTVFAIPTAIQPQTGVSLRLYAKPGAPGEVLGTLLLESTDAIEPVTEVPLRVNGAEAPTAIAEVKSVNGVPPQSGDVQVRPLDDVVITGVNSQPALPTGSIAAYRWTLIEKPPESSVQLTQPNAMETGFSFSSAGGPRSGLDVAGTFIIKLEVTDNNGAVSTNDARVILSSVASERLYIQLTWDSPTNDIDLHLKRSADDYCSDESCYWQNCKPTSFSPPEWDGISGRSAGDPNLDVDDLSGYGPENINVDTPGNGNYQVGVHYFSGTTDTYATVKIYVNGGLAFEASRELVNDDDFWEVAEVQWQNGAAVVAPFNSFEEDWYCF